jgi:hypothetical protein
MDRTRAGGFRQLRDNCLKPSGDKPTENPQAYDLYLRGKRYARRLTHQDVEFALQMFENAVALDPSFAPVPAAKASRAGPRRSCGPFRPVLDVAEAAIESRAR